MLFNSYIFIFIFLPVTFSVYFYLNYKRLVTASKAWLVVSSLFFYSWWNVVYLPLILISILFNYTISRSMDKSSVNKKQNFSNLFLLQVAIVFNIGLLGYFKYMDFFIQNTNFIFGSHIEVLNLALPLAISFFTLQQIAYVVDCYEGLVKERNFLNYVIFVTFFPQLIAGPIVHHKEMMCQFSNIRNKVRSYSNITKGLFIFSIGLFKKVVIADSFSIWATFGFDESNTLNLFEAWATSLSYTFQLYFDFSGYMDMAIGAALLFNIKLPKNFNSPYKATGMIDFWKRWHITLTNFITTYIHTPLIRSLKKPTFHLVMVMTVLTFLISGLWHGASWMYVIFGFLNGVGIVINHYWRKTKIRINIILAWFITFNFVNITFIFFRAEEWDDAVKVITSMFSLDNIRLPNFLSSDLSFLSSYNVRFGHFLENIQGGVDTIIWLVLGFILVLIFSNSNQMVKSFKSNYATLFYASFLFIVSFASLNNKSEFIYFQF